MATTYDNASLVMIPSGVKEDKLYSIKPTDGSGDFTFSRGSDIQATRVNSSGLIEKAKVNLLLQSNSFNTTWVNSTSTETGGQSGYDGTNDAWLLETTGANGRLNQNVTAGVCTLSIYAKAGSVDFLRFQIVGPSDANAYFDLSTGAIGTTGADVIDATITSVGGGWYRCTMSTSSSSTIRIFPAQADGDTSGTSGNIYIQDAALCHGLIAQDYVETTTTAVVEGLTADLPRLDYSGGASCPSLLLEPSRTNIVEQSEYFGAYWTLARTSLTANDATSPEGVANATKVQQSASDTNGGAVFVIRTFTAGSHTYSVFAKTNDVNGADYINLAETASSAGTERTWFNLTNGTIGKTSVAHTADIESMGNGWYRCSITFTANAGNFGILNYLSDGDNITTAVVNSSAYLYGAQLESSASYKTSYIPTYGTAANRGEDVCEDGGDADTFNDSEGVLYAEFSSFIGAGGGTRRIQIQNAGSTQYVRLQIANGDGTLYAIVDNGSQQYLYNDTSFDSTAVNKVALKYAPNNYALYVNGVKVDSQSSGSTFATGVLTETNFSPPSPFYGNIKQTLVFPTALTDAECIALTTI